MSRICILCETWKSGGIEAFLTNAITHMERFELEIDLVAAQLEESVFTKTLKGCGVTFYELSGNVRNVRKNRKAFRRLLEQRHYDVVHLNAYQALSLGYLQLAKKAGVPTRIAHSHNTQLRKSLTQPLKLILHRWARRDYATTMTHRWACSRAAAEFLFADDRGWEFIPNGIDVERFRFNEKARNEIRSTLGLTGKLVIGNVGRLCYQKNQEFLLEVFQHVHAERPDSALLLVGEGEDEAKLKERAKALGLWDSVIFYGTTDRVERLYWAMDLFAFPSRFEGLGIAAVEAQAAGLPVVCSEEIPPEAFMTTAVQRLPLRDSETWAKALLNANAPERESGADCVATAGFAINDVAARVKEDWLE